VNVLVCGLN